MNKLGHSVAFVVNGPFGGVRGKPRNHGTAAISYGNIQSSRFRGTDLTQHLQ